MKKNSKKPKSLIVRKENQTLGENLYSQIREILQEARAKAYRSVNAAMVEAYWNVGRLIVEEEQKGRGRASYGDHLMKAVADRLTGEFGKGFTTTNLWYMRQFYLVFPILHALRGELSWTHYRLLLKVEKEAARKYYMDEAVAGNWSTRQLERQINSFYYERILASRNKKPILDEAKEKLAQVEPEQFVHDPYILEFLNLKDYPGLRESEIETAIINNLQHFLLEQGDNPTIGLILCSKKNEAIAKYSILNDSKRLFASKYKLYLPTEGELKKELEHERALVEQGKKLLP